MRVLDLFSGVGMFAYGMEQAGHEVVAFCEIEEWPRRVLDKHWPDVPKYTDVRELNRERLIEDGVLADAGCGRCREPAEGEVQRARGTATVSAGSTTDQVTDQVGAGSIDIITGGFPCQDLSVAGKQAGIHGERSGLFDEIVRLASELRPRYIVLENVPALLTGDSGGWARYVFGRLTEIGFDAEWHVIPAGNPNGLSAGAPHRRERVWIVAYTQRERGRSGNASGKDATDAGQLRGSARQNAGGMAEGSTEPDLGLLANGITTRLARSRWLPEPGIGRVATGVPDRVQKLKALGNGLVWQIPYAIGCAINDRKDNEH